ncbi:ATP-binding protein [Amycolatopsis nigrescens]|uniref:ATP-binding protein n=1 Tax=Amycolatopsis nigrescens TaxID=381445 RepID=UPI0003662FA2
MPNDPSDNHAGDAADARVFEVRTSAMPDSVPTLRTIAADLAMRQDFDLDAVEDVRMAVDEACNLLVPAASDGWLNCAFTASAGSLAVRVSVLSDGPGLVRDDALGWQLLTALATTVRRSVTPTDQGYVSQVDLVRESETTGR